MYSNELSEIVANQRDTKNGHVIEPNHTKQNRNRRSLSKIEQFGMNLATIFKFQAVKNYCITASIRTKFLILGDFFLLRSLPKDLFTDLSMDTARYASRCCISILAGSLCTMIFLCRAPEIFSVRV